MLEEWRPIESFPWYSVSSTGHVRNEESGRAMTLLVNQSGVVNVGLTKNCRQYKRAVGLLVANAFELPRPNEAFDCPINLNGDRFNNSVLNLAWRPRWFATRYFDQFEETHFEDYYPIENVETYEWFKNPWDAVRNYGLLQRDVILGLANRTAVWPIRQHFRESS